MPDTWDPDRPFAETAAAVYNPYVVAAAAAGAACTARPKNPLASLGPIRIIAFKIQQNKIMK
jgi:hypothetical protein